MGKTLSICVVCSKPKTLDFPLKECLESVVPIADEIVLINADSYDSNSEVLTTLWGNKNMCFREDINWNVIRIPWQSRMKKNMWWLMKSMAISQASSDYVIRLDSDEVLHEKDYDKIKKAMELDHPFYAFRTLHFWRDYGHTIGGANSTDGGQDWYERRPYMFKNNLGVYENLYDLVDVDGNTLNCKNLSVEVFHYGHCRNKEAYLEKKNGIEKAYHSDWKDLQEWEWSMENTSFFEGTHPEVMKERIEQHKKQNPNYYTR